MRGLMQPNLPSIAVLLASHNGAEWIDSQISTILAARDVHVHIFLSDDGSTDDTVQIAIDASGGSLTVLPRKKMGSAGANFYRVLIDAPWDEYDYIALADQDDLWNSGKLYRGVQAILDQSLDAYSSNVTAFWPNDREQLIEKSQPQQKLDYLFEGAGPGNTFLFPVESAIFLREKLRAMEPRNLDRIDPHDWFFYALIRSADKRWFIDSFSGLQYRQHGNNVMGAAKGIVAIRQRIGMITSNWYRSQILQIAAACQVSNPIIDYVSEPKISKIWVPLRYGLACRRKRSEAVVVTVFFIWLAFFGAQAE